jgi:hypothetical protein
LALELLLVHADAEPTLEQVTLALDGQLLGTATSDPPSSTTPPMHASALVAAGAHSLRATVTRQTTSPNRYTLSGTGSWGGREFDVGPATATLATGGSLEVHLTL